MNAVDTGTYDKIKVMQAWLDGEAIEYSHNGGSWVRLSTCQPRWGWSTTIYRIIKGASVSDVTRLEEQVRELETRLEKSRLRNNILLDSIRQAVAEHLEMDG